MPHLILASASPRRRELLEQIGVHFHCRPVDICEDPLPKEPAHEYVTRLAKDKALAGLAQAGGDAVVLGADTTVAIDDHILAKPGDEHEAIAMLMQLSARRHQVLTAVALAAEGRVEVCCVGTDVEFIELDEARCRQYWRTGEPCDKAGAYGIQGLGAVFVKNINGSYSAVVGLPLMETAAMLQRFDIPLWQPN
ncbi:Maf family protein [Marinobacterium sp. MBR-109]|jgi:septum formation protein|uniref:Maf family protein n=1 Tax=Marinobacterium sp. MBR-109 TaxID=3156462 RepID=UPI003392D34E